MGDPKTGAPPLAKLLGAPAKVGFRCHLCMAEIPIDEPSEYPTVSVPARNPHEPIANWMREFVVPAVQVEHRKRSPKCDAVAVSLAFFLEPDGHIGMGAPTDD